MVGPFHVFIRRDLHEIEMLDGSEEVGVRKRGEFLELLRMPTQRLVSRRVSSHNCDDDDEGDDCGCDDDDEADNNLLSHCISLARQRVRTHVSLRQLTSDQSNWAAN